MTYLTEKQREAMQIIHENPNLTASQFAFKFWPEKQMHVKVSNQGHGSCGGKAAWLCGGSYLAKLIEKKLVKITQFNANKYKLTEKGEIALEHPVTVKMTPALERYLSTISSKMKPGVWFDKWMVISSIRRTEYNLERLVGAGKLSKVVHSPGKVYYCLKV